MKKGQLAKYFVHTICIATLLFTTAASAEESVWDKNHPRRAEVNQRITNQRNLISQERKTGEITKNQAQQLREQEHQIRVEERMMSHQNGGGITGQEQKVLNEQENKLRREIKTEGQPQSSQTGTPASTTTPSPVTP